MAHPSESGRFYWPDGSPAYEIESKGGKLIKPDIRHARKLGLKPSVTTILSEAAKPGLVRWQVQQGILSALTLPRQEGESLDDFAQRAMRDSQEQARKAAEKGTQIHAAIQEFYGGGCERIELEKYVISVADAVAERYRAAGAPEWEPEQVIHREDYGGKKDLSRPGVTLDFKCKEFTSDDLKAGKKLAWDEHCIQLAAYREPGDRCANVFVSVNEPGLVHIHEWKEDELQRGWKMFEALKAYYYARNGL